MAEEVKKNETETKEEIKDEVVETKEEIKEEIEEQKKEEKLFSQAELDKRIAEEIAKKEKAIEKAKKLAEMNAEQRLQEELKEARKERDEYKTKHILAELKDKAQAELKSNGLDTSFAEFLLGADEEATSKNIKGFKEVWEAALKNATDKILSGNTPKNPKTLNKEDDPVLSAFDKAGW